MLCGLLTPTEGTGAVAGHDLRTSSGRARAALGYMAQKFSLYGELSVAQNLNFFAGAYGLEGREAKRAVERVTEIFELGERMKATAGTLPLGFKQRLALACAVMHEPPVLFLDEPTSGVDPGHAARILDAYQRAGRKGRGRAGHHPFHGRGRILRRDHADLPRRTDRNRHA